VPDNDDLGGFLIDIGSDLEAAASLLTRRM
jgi:hypothetical protein